MEETVRMYRALATLQGFALDESRLEALAAALERHAASERAATGVLEFEVEPSSFVGTLEREAA